MKNDLKYSDQAIKDLDDIWDYISVDLASPTSAQNTVNRILDDAERLSDFPEIGPALRNITHMATDYRYIVSGSYSVFYRISHNTVYIDRILYGRRDYMRILFDDMQGNNMPL